MPGKKSMQKKLRLVLLSICCGVLLLQASPIDSGHEATSPDPAWAELNSSIMKMHVAMASVKPSGNSDVDFVKLMLPHHQAAINMAKTQLLNGKDPQVRRLAQEIVTEQQSEIQLMELWLKQQKPVPPTRK